jgi:plasmid stabilization system protein ParE
MVLRDLAIRWAAPAESDLDALLSFIALENPDAAIKLFEKVTAAIEHAASFPEMARYIPELGHTYRELISVRPFRVIYRISQKELWVIGVMRMEQDFAPERFIEN